MRPFNFIALAALVVMLASAAFGQTAGVKGTVKAQNGKGIANASVLVRRDGKDVKSTRADSKGQFSITGLSEGKYNVVFDADGYETGVFYNVELANGSVRDLGDRLILSVDRGTQVIVIGSVFSKEGYVLPGAKVTVERIRPDGKAKSIGKGYTNESGEFSFRQQPGDARFRITAKFRDAEGSTEVEVNGPALYRWVINLDVKPKGE